MTAAIIRKRSRLRQEWMRWPGMVAARTLQRGRGLVLSDPIGRSVKMQGILYEEPSIWQFFFVTCLLGGGAAWMTGRACAQTWRSYVSLVLYLLLLGIAVRFIHHALFNGTMFSAQYYIVDTVVLLIIGSLGFRYTRTNQMVTQYNWLYERSSPLGWKPKG
jgi:hypothetical protein